MLFLHAVAVAATADVPQVRFTVERFVVEGDNPFSHKQTQKLLQPYLGEHQGLTRLEEAAQALGDRLKKKGYAFSRVVIPPQKLKGGVVTLNVLSFKLDQVTLEGNKQFSDRNILASLPPLQRTGSPETGGDIQVGEMREFPSIKTDRTLNTLEIARMLRVANEHPSKKVAVFIREGEVPETINARVVTQESRPVLFRYMGRVEKARTVGNIYVEYAVNTGSGGENGDLNYTLNRFGADENWQALRYGGDVDVLLPKNWRFLGRLQGQAAGEPLIPGEQFGLGGIRSVRGYEERELSTDSGQFLSGEVWTRPFFKNLRIIGFFDAGWGQIEDPLPGQPEHEFIAGTGLGLRWFWKQYVSLSVDAAVALDNAFETDAGDGKIHFNLFLKY